MSQTLKVAISGMSCDHCVRSVTEAIREVPGVTRVDVSLEAKSARVEGTDIDVAKLVAAVAEEGYEASPQ